MPDIDLDAPVPPPPPQPETPGASFSADQFTQLIEAIRGNQADAISLQAEATALAQKKILHPQNETYPGVSVYNPRGERDHPRADLKCPMYYGQYELDRDTLTGREIDLLNRLTPGIYEVTKADGSTVPFSVRPIYKLDGQTLDLLRIHWPAADSDQRQNYPPLGQMLKEVTDQIAVNEITGGTRG